jgi:predicted aldo/keto reductase-like oxidoreductase
MSNHYLGEEIPKLGFGLMRLPMIGEEVDLEQTKKMVDLFMEKGFTYFDTAYPYINGKSEVAAGEALVKRYPREAFQLATKLPLWMVRKQEDMQPIFDTQLERTGAGYFDFYLLHAIDRERVDKIEEAGAWKFGRELKEKGLIRHLGFSFHDEAEVLDQILTKHPEAEFVQLQINYADWENEKIQSRLCYEVARKHNKPIIVMEPVKGGALATMSPEVQSLLKPANPDLSVASWAVRYAASLDGIITVLSGMSSLEQMEDNLSYMMNFKPLQDAEYKILAKVTEELEKVPVIPCTSCKYCVEDCPQKINIPGIFEGYNNYKRYRNLEGAKGHYKWLTGGSGKASDCIACGTCEGHCPQHIDIIDRMQEIAGVLE